MDRQKKVWELKNQILKLEREIEEVQSTCKHPDKQLATITSGGVKFATCLICSKSWELH